MGTSLDSGQDRVVSSPVAVEVYAEKRQELCCCITQQKRLFVVEYQYHVACHLQTVMVPVICGGCVC